ncbi:MAG: leucyl/phenylalanyl-tRNA--protein transferase [Planctomycetia bacterium]|nr:leucyl/phenylalanyl-tRNA--protein transferase [Planctomycetia bacterium]
MLAVGGELTPEWLYDAYSHGIFPWPNNDESPMLWWSLPTRAVLEFETFHISRRLRQRLRSGVYEITLDQAFPEVLIGCADRKTETWITPNMMDGYYALYRAGFAHSLEVWWEEELVGGIYGVAIGAFFAGESMFYRMSDASKVALAWMVRHLQSRGFQLFDVQLTNSHLAQFHPNEIPRDVYLKRLNKAIHSNVTFGTELAWERENF